MKQAWLGVAVGLAIGVTAVLLTQGSPPAPAPVRTTSPKAGELVARCTAPLVPTYEQAVAAVHAALAAEPAKALAAAQGPVANVIDIRLAVCEQALAVRQADRRRGGSGAEVDRDITRLMPVLEKLRVAHARLRELISALQSPSGSGAAASLDALDAAIREVGSGS